MGFLYNFLVKLWFLLLFWKVQNKTVFYAAVEKTGLDSVLKVSLRKHGEWQLGC